MNTSEPKKERSAEIATTAMLDIIFHELEEFDEDGRRVRPLVNPRDCTEEEIEMILNTDPTASKAYERELDRRKRMEEEAEYWEDRLSV